MSVIKDAVYLYIEDNECSGDDRFGNDFFGIALFEESIEIANLEYLADVVIDLRTQVKSITVSNCPSLVKLTIYEPVQHLNIDGCPELKELTWSQSTPGLNWSHAS